MIYSREQKHTSEIEQVFAEIRKALASANAAQSALSKDDNSWGLYYVNGVQCRLKQILQDKEKRIIESLKTYPRI